jgi:hypothetical protein
MDTRTKKVFVIIVLTTQGTIYGAKMMVEGTIIGSRRGDVCLAIHARSKMDVVSSEGDV